MDDERKELIKAGVTLFIQTDQGVFFPFGRGRTTATSSAMATQEVFDILSTLNLGFEGLIKTGSEIDDIELVKVDADFIELIGFDINRIVLEILQKTYYITLVDYEFGSAYLKNLIVLPKMDFLSED
ncbi:hypothetical protein [Methanobrevibacter curvatus]|uniref:Uncharacterized protein n=1 Tax=Methanobrevibacter curvatus TaxID=49547 RepID=A0A166B297_9EURY|nr:hypothetical protein [Methanobrevibacter curvatus]KZX12774.1 hypothetical protein MBCUR_09160 [Methanobrevibacter curvatus]